MVTDEERRLARATFGADDSQVDRDHVISHALAAIARDLNDSVKFFGGTALARAYLPDGRLSEDIDLIAVGERSAVAARLGRCLTRGLAREFGRPTFRPDIATSPSTRSVSVAFPSGPMIQLQLLPSDHFPAWPFVRRELHQRFADAGPAELLVPSLDAIVAWKTVAYLDRQAPRDLFDLAQLARIGAFSPRAADLFARFGQFTSPPTTATLPRAPDEVVWLRDLTHQTRLTYTSAKAWDMVARAWSTVTSG